MTIRDDKTVQMPRDVDAVKVSKSRLMPAPLRHAIRLTRILPRAALTIRHQALLRGGFGSALAYYWAVVRREGPRGIRTRLARLNEGMGFADSPPSDEFYRKWIERFDSLDDTKRAEIRKSAEAFPRKPLISVVVPTYNSDKKLLREMIDSVRAQLYPHWELCIADDASTDPAVSRVLVEASAADSRIRFVIR